MVAAAHGDTAAFEGLYRRHVDAVVRFSVRRARTPEEVVDLVAAVWLEVIASLHRFRPELGEPLPWILGIAANLCATERRRQTREREVLRRLSGRRVLGEDDFERLERAIDAVAVAPEVRRALASLSRSERAVAELVLLDGLTPAQAGEVLHVAPAAVRMRLTRARRKLRAVAESSGTAAPPIAVKEVSP
jgi:RNA polymerase sigma-70 factor (ECF subfamily)